MKTQAQTLFDQISDTTIKNLAIVVEETLAKGANNSRHKTFSSADLWNIHRQRKTFVIR